MKKVDCALLPRSLPSLTMHLKRTNYVTILWANAHLANPTHGLSPDDYGWFVKDRSLHIKWYEEPAMPSSNFFRNENESSCSKKVSLEEFDDEDNEIECIKSNDEAWLEYSDQDDS